MSPYSLSVCVTLEKCQQQFVLSTRIRFIYSDNFILISKIDMTGTILRHRHFLGEGHGRRKVHERIWHGCSCFLGRFLFQQRTERTWPKSWTQRCYHSSCFTFFGQLLLWRCPNQIKQTKKQNKTWNINADVTHLGNSSASSFRPAIAPQCRIYRLSMQCHIQTF